LEGQDEFGSCWLSLSPYTTNISKTLQACADSEAHLCSELQAKQLSVGIAAMNNAYHHLTVLLTHANPNFKAICVQAARNCLAILPNLVSSSPEVYNGSVWYVFLRFHQVRKANRVRQLLYFPLTSFMVVYEAMVADPSQPTNASDFVLLRTTVTFYARMEEKVKMATSLRMTTEKYARLAEDQLMGTPPTQALSSLSTEDIRNLDTGSNTTWSSRDNTASNSPPPNGMDGSAVYPSMNPLNESFDWLMWDMQWDQAPAGMQLPFCTDQMYL
jgi:hypothetical protein